MQKFHKGDWVRVAKDLGSFMRYFPSDCEAIVIGSYADECGPDTDEEESYEIYIKGHGETAWYHEHQLCLLESGRLDKLKEWKDAEIQEAKLKGNLDWIFANGQAVIDGPHAASIKTLAKCLGLGNLWGRSGEGMTYYINARCTLLQAEPFLKSGDKAGWLVHCKSMVAV